VQDQLHEEEERTEGTNALIPRIRVRCAYGTAIPAGRSNLSAAIIPDNYVKYKNTERERER